MSKLQFAVLASGSKGNAVAVFPGDGPGFLLDCGLSQKVLQKRLEIVGKNLEDIQGAFITHHHGDHFNGSGLSGMSWIRSIFTQVPANPADDIDGCMIKGFKLSHGDLPCHGFRVDYKEMSFAYLVDTEYVPEESLKYLFDLDAIIIEANYRENMIKGRSNIHGDPTSRHLSNEQAACVLGLINSTRLKHVIMAHGSSRNNTPAFACNAGTWGAPQAQVLWSEQDRPTKMITLMS